MHMETLHHKSYSKEPVKYLILRVCKVTIHFEAVTLKPNRWQLRARNIRTTNWTKMVTQQAQNISITLIQRRSNVFDVGPALYTSYTNVFCLWGWAQEKKTITDLTGFSGLIHLTKSWGHFSYWYCCWSIIGVWSLWTVGVVVIISVNSSAGSSLLLNACSPHAIRIAVGYELWIPARGEHVTQCLF